MSAVRDLGYKPYEGQRLPPSHNAWVMFRHGLSRAWESWLVKLAVVLGMLPAFVHVAGLAFIGYKAREQIAMSPDGLSVHENLTAMLTYQLWLFVSAVTLGAGASTLTEDAALKTFPFYFAKPVTPVHYLVGRIGAVAALCFALFVLPSTALVLIGAAVESPLRQRAVLELLPKALLFSAVAAGVLASTSVGVSAIGRSRALTMSGWILIFIVPYVIATLLELFIEWPWLKLVSIPSLLDVIEQALFIPLEDGAAPSEVRWYHAAVVLASLTAASIGFTHSRLRRTEVIA